MNKWKVMFAVPVVLMLVACVQATPMENNMSSEPNTTTQLSQTEHFTTENGMVQDGTEPVEENQNEDENDEEPPAHTTPQSLEEIVAFYNIAANQLKIDRPGFTQTERTIIDDSDLEVDNRVINAAAPGIIRMAQNSFSSWSDPEVVPRGACHNEFFAAGQSWASRLQPGWVQTATIRETAQEYHIQIFMRDERVPEPPTNAVTTRHGQVMKVFSYEDIMEGIERIPGIDIRQWDALYSGSYIQATICRETGNMLRTRFFMNSYVTMQVRTLGLTTQVLLPIAQEYVFTINQ